MLDVSPVTVIFSYLPCHGLYHIMNVYLCPSLGNKLNKDKNQVCSFTGVSPRFGRLPGQGSNSEMLNFKSIEFTDHLCCIWQLTGYLYFHLCGASLTHENTHAFLKEFSGYSNTLLLKRKMQDKDVAWGCSWKQLLWILVSIKKEDGKIDKRKQEMFIYSTSSYLVPGTVLDLGVRWWA